MTKKVRGLYPCMIGHGLFGMIKQLLFLLEDF